MAFNRIAGPGAVPGFNQACCSLGSIRISRWPISRPACEIWFRTWKSPYWELYFAYRNLDTAVVGRDSALQTWQKVDALRKAGAKGGEAATESPGSRTILPLPHHGRDGPEHALFDREQVALHEWDWLPPTAGSFGPSTNRRPRRSPSIGRKPIAKH